MANQSTDLRLIRVDPQPEYIESSGRWKWPLQPPHDNDGRCSHVYTASREWWEYVPSGAKPHEWAEGVRLRDDVWYWAVPVVHEVERMRVALERIARWMGEFPPTGQKWDDGTPMSYSACFGSNGERDYMRSVAREALTALKETP
jgi:hypothetical protein